jgi:hypothetical protein
MPSGATSSSWRTASLSPYKGLGPDLSYLASAVPVVAGPGAGQTTAQSTEVDAAGGPHLDGGLLRPLPREIVRRGCMCRRMRLPGMTVLENWKGVTVRRQSNSLDRVCHIFRTLIGCSAGQS